jgi:predicted acylesterase/phospholipase RssA
MALDALDPLNVRRLLDPGFLLNARRALLPLPVVDRSDRSAAGVLPPFESRPVAGLRGKRVGVVGGAGGGACVALVGVARALEEAGVEPEAIAACSGSAIWGAMWAGGMTADEMAEFSLAWRPADYLGVQWAGLPRFAVSAARGFAGLRSDEALERLFQRRLWHMRASETAVPLHTLGYDMSSATTVPLGTEHTPELTLGELARIAVAPPRASDAVRVEGDLYVDGSVVDRFPAGLLDDRLDHVIGLDVAQAGGSEHDDRLTLVEPAPAGRGRAMSFYDLFLDRRDWPALIGHGYRNTIDALAPLRRRRKARA